MTMPEQQFKTKNVFVIAADTFLHYSEELLNR